MNNIYKIFGVLLLGCSILISSCKKEETAYEYAQGVWYFTFNCGGGIDPALLGISLPDSVNVQGIEDNQLLFSLSLGLIGEVALKADIDDNGILDIQPQNIDISEISNLPFSISVSGSGEIKSSDKGDITLNFVIPLADAISCFSDLTRGDMAEGSDN